jgi:hypothetical protein
VLAERTAAERSGGERGERCWWNVAANVGFISVRQVEGAHTLQKGVRVRGT